MISYTTLQAVRHTLKGATAQTAVDFETLREQTKLAQAELDAALNKMLAEREVNTARLIKDGHDRTVWWLTGVIAHVPYFRLAATANKRPPIIPVSTPSKPINKENGLNIGKPSKTSRAVDLIRKRECIGAKDISEETGIPAKNLDALMCGYCRHHDDIERIKMDGRTHWATKVYADKVRAEDQATSVGEQKSESKSAALEIPAFLRKDQPAKCEPTRAESDAGAIFDFDELHINARGRLKFTLTDGSVVALAPAETARLGRFMLGTQGVWGGSSA